MNSSKEQLTLGDDVSSLADLLQLVLERMGNAVVWFDREGHALYANAAACRCLEYPREELLARRILDFAPDLNPGLWLEHWQGAGAAEEATTEIWLRSRNGRVFPAEISSSRHARGSDEFICSIVRDISAREQEQDAMRLAKAIYMSSNEAIMVTNRNNHIMQVNPAFTRITDYTLDDLFGKNPGVLWAELHGDAFHQEMWKELNDVGYWQGEMWNRRKDGELFASYVTVSVIRNEDGSLFGHAAQFVEITEKKRRDEQTWWHANYDALTALPNRRLFLDRLEQEVRKSNRSGRKIALMFVDLDRFKEVNDHLGHDKGDLLLAEAARRLDKCVRETDTVARLGGDEFTIILPDYGSRADLERIARTIIRKLNEAFPLEDKTASILASIGIAIYPDDAGTDGELLNCADQAMYKAKKKGRNQAAFFSKPRTTGNSRNSYSRRRHLYFQRSK